MTTTQAYDAVNRLTEVSSAPAGANAGTYCCAYDGNGNVMALVSAADGSVAARYEYGPFGELIRATGPMAKTNPFLFSTKYYDWETGLYYYGYRYYDPSTGRWLSRDPIDDLAFRSRDAQSLGPKERGALFRRPPSGNEYLFLDNNAVGIVDPLGLIRWCGTCETYGASVAVGVQFLECYLTTPCDSQCRHEYVHVKAWFGVVSASPLPVNFTKFRTCFETPEHSDYAAFDGAARMVTITVSPGVGKTGGRILLGEAESEGVDNTSGIDWDASFGAGRSWVRTHYARSCK